MEKLGRAFLITLFSVSWIVWILAALIAGSDRAVLTGISVIGSIEKYAQPLIKRF